MRSSSLVNFDGVRDTYEDVLSYPPSAVYLNLKDTERQVGDTLYTNELGQVTFGDLLPGTYFFSDRFLLQRRHAGDRRSDDH